jgi:uncharacterized membrane protein
MQIISILIDWIGIGIILVGIVYSAFKSVMIWHETSISQAYISFRRNLARTILLGLEFLIAGDIIRSVAETPTFEQVSVLGIIVLIRTILSIALQVEIDGKLPWTK